MNSTEILSELYQEIRMSARNPKKPDREEASKAICITINRLYNKLCAMQNDYTSSYTPVSVTFHTSDIVAYHNNQKNIDGSVSIPKECIEVETDQAEIKRASAEGSTVVALIVKRDQNGKFEGTMMSDIPTQHYGDKRRANDALERLSGIIYADADKGALNITSDKYEYTLNATGDDPLRRRRRRHRG